MPPRVVTDPVVLRIELPTDAQRAVVALQAYIEPGDKLALTNQAIVLTRPTQHLPEQVPHDGGPTRLGSRQVVWPAGDGVEAEG